MKLDFDQGNNAATISEYSEDGIVIAGRNLDSPFLVIGEDIVSKDLPANVDGLNETHIRSILARKIDIIIIGAGPQQVFPDAKVLIPALTHGVGVEVMETGAACRSYNVLVAENRLIAGLFFPLHERKNNSA